MARSKTKGRNKQRKNRGDGKESPPQAGLDSVPPTEQNTTQPNQVTDTPRRNSDTTTSVPQPIRTQGTQVQQGSTSSALSSTQGNLNVVSTSHGTPSIMDLNSPNRSVGALKCSPLRGMTTQGTPHTGALVDEGLVSLFK